ncbi:helix-turn-helix domain-containing protein [candidate division NPL-UPA2 bacterium]|nr:helix-turn-helix domain-containing protein [candidate division NPL-UPA2 bacterium]
MKRSKKTIKQKPAYYYKRPGLGYSMPRLELTGMPVVMNTKELATYLRLNPFTIVKKAEKGEIPAFKIGRMWRFRSDEIDAWIKGKSKPAQSFPQRVDRVFKKIRIGLEKAGYSVRDIEGLIQEVREQEAR